MMQGFVLGFVTLPPNPSQPTFLLTQTSWTVPKTRPMPPRRRPAGRTPQRSLYGAIASCCCRFANRSASIFSFLSSALRKESCSLKKTSFTLLAKASWSN